MAGAAAGVGPDFAPRDRRALQACLARHSPPLNRHARSLAAYAPPVVTRAGWWRGWDRNPVVPVFRSGPETHAMNGSCQAAWTGGGWECRVLLRSGLMAVVVPSGFR